MLDFESLESRRETVAVVGLGYVGLPLLVHLAGHFAVLGFDIDAGRIKELGSGRDRTGEVSPEALEQADIEYTSDPEALKACRLIIVAVPTPIDGHNRPDLSPLIGASNTVGTQLTRGSCVVYESTVYPGATEEVCIPLLEEQSGLSCGRDFSVGYSPERINPGDKVHTLDRIVKVVAGSDTQTSDLLAQVYGKVALAGVHQAPSLKVAEAAKVIENTQRDLNIALMNELAMIFHRMGIDSNDVLRAAGTKWNFLPFRPGLVGGHCIGVDPYYLTYKAESLGYHPEMILAGRRINDSMGKVVAERLVKLLIRTGTLVRGARVAVLGLTFKENVPDIRNTKVVDILHELQDFGVEALVHDPVADPVEAREHCGIELQTLEACSEAEGVILAVGHQAYQDMGLSRIAALCRGELPVVLDVKSLFAPTDAAAKGMLYERL
jgi:UDP-N-acetyl-D-galactosamine dehydrogenase